MTEIRHLENRHNVIFFCWRGPILIKFRRLVQNGMSTAVIWWKSKPDVELQWRTFGRIPWHVIPEPPVTLQGAATEQIQRHVIPEPRITLQGAATWWIHCHDSRATCHIAGCSHLPKSMSWSCHIAGCNISIRHIKNRFRHILLYSVF